MIPRPDLLTPDSPRGLEIFQITCEAIPASHIYMEAQIFTPDSQRFVLHRSAHAHGSDRHDPEHRYLLCDCRTGQMEPLTRELGPTEPAISPDGQWFYYFVDETDVNAGRLSLKRLRLDNPAGRPETIVVIDTPLEGAKSRISMMYPISTISSDGRRIATCGYLGDGVRPNAPWGLLVIDIEKAQPRLILQGQSYCNLHPQYSRSLDPATSRDILIQENHGCDVDARGEFVKLVSGLGADIHVIRDDGTNMRDMPWGRVDGGEQCQGHQCWRGRSATAVTTAGNPARKLDIPNPDNWQYHEEGIIEGLAAPHTGHDGTRAPGSEGRRNVLSRSFAKPRFFHFATDIAGERFITDCNPLNPDHCELWLARFGKSMEEPLKDWTYLLDMKTRFWGKDGKSAHPHPFLSPDGKLAFFNSNESGLLQAYMVRGLPA